MRPFRLIALLSVVVVALMAMPALAKQATSHPAHEAAQEQQASQPRHLEGRVSSVDPENNTLGIEPRPGLGAVMLNVTSGTRFEGPGVKDLRSVREGEHIQASYQEQEGRNVAESVRVIPEGEGRGGAEAPAGGAQQKAPSENEPPQAVPRPPSPSGR